MNARTFCFAASLLVSTMVMLGISATTNAQPDDETLRSVSDLYKAADWPKGEIRDGFPLNALELEGWRGGQLRVDNGYLQRKFTSTNGEQAVIIDAYVAESAEAAHRALLMWLAGRQAPEAAPRVQERDLNVGDVGFLGLAGADRQTIAWIAFVRGNVALRVRNTNPKLHPDLDLGAVARMLDEQVSSRNAAAPELPRIEKFAAARGEVITGDVVRLDLVVADPAQGNAEVNWTVGGSGQGYVEADADNVWHLHTTGAGKIELLVDVVSSTGTVVSQGIEINVLPRKRK